MNIPQSVSQQFISIVRTIAKTYGMDLEAPYCCLRLEQEPYPALIVEKMGKSLLSVAKHWHVKGQPSPQVKAVGSRFSPLAPLSVPPSWDEDNQPVLHLHGNYLIEGNKTGLLALMEAAATALTKQTQGTEEVFDANAYLHLLQVKLSTNGA